MRFIELFCLFFVFVLMATFCSAAEEGDLDATDFHCQPIRDEKQNPKRINFPTATTDKTSESGWSFFG